MSVATDNTPGAGGRRFRRIASQGGPLLLLVAGMLIFALGVGSEDAPSLRALRAWGLAVMGAGVVLYLAQVVIAFLARRK